MGFTQHFIGIIMKCISTPTFTILIKYRRSTINSIQDWQGTPAEWLLSPILFNMTMKVLSQEFHRAERLGQINFYTMVGAKSVLTIYRASARLIHDPYWLWEIHSTTLRVLQAYLQQSQERNLRDNILTSGWRACENSEFLPLKFFLIIFRPVKNLFPDLIRSVNRD